MKVVILAAGKGRRLGEFSKQSHKSLVKLDDLTMIDHIIENCLYAGCRDFVPILGHNHGQVLEYFLPYMEKGLKHKKIINASYEKTNNLFSLFCAREELEGKDFLLINGDVVIDRTIIEGILKTGNSSDIAVDDFAYKEPVDSPGVLTRNSRIHDLGRHLPFNVRNGYAIGVYKIGKELSSKFFLEAEKMLKVNLNAGFHDPLPLLFEKEIVYPYRTDGRLWTDIDCTEDIPKAREIHQKILKNYKNIQKQTNNALRI
jgi:choline kinase